MDKITMTNTLKCCTISNISSKNPSPLPWYNVGEHSRHDYCITVDIWDSNIVPGGGGGGGGGDATIL
jgi:hypothetical protein